MEMPQHHSARLPWLAIGDERHERGDAPSPASTARMSPSNHSGRTKMGALAAAAADFDTDVGKEAGAAAAAADVESEAAGVGGPRHAGRRSTTATAMLSRLRLAYALTQGHTKRVVAWTWKEIKIEFA